MPHVQTVALTKNNEIILIDIIRNNKKRLEIPGGKVNEFKERLLAIIDYEEQIDEESKFVYALDKILPPLNIYLDNGRTWRKYKVKLDMIKENKDKKF